jgi:hypothetical protein
VGEVELNLAPKIREKLGKMWRRWRGTDFTWFRREGTSGRAPDLAGRGRQRPAMAASAWEAEVGGPDRWGRRAHLSVREGERRPGEGGKIDLARCGPKEREARERAEEERAGQGGGRKDFGPKAAQSEEGDFNLFFFLFN